MRKDSFVKTPRLNVPLGMAFKKPDGTYCLRIKKPHTPHYEDVSIDEILKLVISKAENPNDVDSTENGCYHI